MVDPTLLQVAGLDPQQIGLEIGGGAVIGGGGE